MKNGPEKIKEIFPFGILHQPTLKACDIQEMMSQEIVVFRCSAGRALAAK